MILVGPKLLEQINQEKVYVVHMNIWLQNLYSKKVIMKKLMYGVLEYYYLKYYMDDLHFKLKVLKVCNYNLKKNKFKLRKVFLLKLKI